MFLRMFISLWSFAMKVLPFFARYFGWIFPKAGPFVQSRILQRSDWESLSEKRATFELCYVFYCSSAGEYEQAIPIIESLEETYGQTLFVHIFFFSQSGIKFAKARQETRSYSLAPLDSKGNWRRLFSALKPTATVVIRHEIWPGFLMVAKEWGPLFLANASSLGSMRAHRGLRKLTKSWLLNQFDQILVVSGQDKQIFQDLYQFPDHKIIVTGDSKYDRALNRAQRVTEGSQWLETQIKALFGDAPILIVGSGWDDDFALCFKAYEIRRQQNFPPSKLILAPHEVTPESVDKLWKTCEQSGLTPYLYSSLGQTPEKPADVLIIDCLGILAGIYRVGNWAWVGGALHNQVHNVLEPASHGLAIAFGPRYTNSQEAQELVKNGLAKVIRRPEEFALWWQHSDQARTLGQATLSYLKPMLGAGKRMTKYLVI